jgi:hypothetical protein
MHKHSETLCMCHLRGTMLMMSYKSCGAAQMQVSNWQWLWKCVFDSEFGDLIQGLESRAWNPGPGFQVCLSATVRVAVYQKPLLHITRTAGVLHVQLVVTLYCSHSNLNPYAGSVLCLDLLCSCRVLEPIAGSVLCPDLLCRCRVCRYLQQGVDGVAWPVPLACSCVAWQGTSLFVVEQSGTT